MADDKCGRCDGTGVIKGGFGGEDIPPTTCPDCRGSGKKRKKCKDCLGYGIRNSKDGPIDCESCGGSGNEPET